MCARTFSPENMCVRVFPLPLLLLSARVCHDDDDDHDGGGRDDDDATSSFTFSLLLTMFTVHVCALPFPFIRETQRLREGQQKA